MHAGVSTGVVDCDRLGWTIDVAWCTACIPCFDHVFIMYTMNVSPTIEAGLAVPGTLIVDIDNENTGLQVIHCIATWIRLRGEHWRLL